MNSFVGYLVVVAVVVAVAAAVPRNGVVHYNIDESEQRLFDFLMKPGKNAVTPTLGKFIFKNCGNPSKDLANIRNITLSPDPVVFPGKMTIGFQVDINKDLDAPLKGQIVISRRVGSVWIKIPCIGVIGSCKYDDVCELLQGATCPPPFVTNNVPCKCPFNAGKYTLPPSDITVEVPVFPAGDYHAVANLTYNAAPVACADLFVTFG